MNTNFGRTILGVLAGGGFMAIVAMLLGCTGGDNPLTPIVEPYECTASWLPSTWAAIVPMALMLLAGVLKMIAPGATVAQNLVQPKAVILPEAIAGPGNVTQAQVDEK